MNNLQKFQELLKKIFQFESSDLDFGIYRILNYKRKQIKKFINEDLKEKVESAFAKHKDERLKNIDKRFEDVKEKIIQTLGDKVFTPTGDLKEEYKNTNIGKEFITLKAQKEEIEAIDEIKNNVFNDLYNFFSRYYEEGDFIPQHRYSIKGHKYAIPYNGEEVKLYWANADQYYIKTGLLFRDYTFKVDHYKIIFRTVSAKEELGSNKATKQRFFILDDENPIEEKDSEIIVRFQYRELFEGEDIVKIYKQKFKDKNTNIEDNSEEGNNNNKSKKIKQENLNVIIQDQIIEKLKNNTIKLLLQKEYKKDSKGNPVSILDYHLNRFTAKNTRDYFIHKNLKKFLSEQLDYFIKSEVLDIETIEKERFLDKHITRAKVVREIGETIIDFLSQIEDFQKRLWEKKKFVIKTEYVITTDRIPEEFYDEIWENEKQKKEWEELGFEIPKKKEDLKNSKLPVDTKYFSSEFKEKLLEKLTEEKDLDDLLDGLLIKSENWQALNTILNKYKGTIKTIYIDPPYNTGSDEFLYRDRYQHSSWLSMMENRLSLAKELMSDDGVIFVSIDDNELERLKIIMMLVYGEDKFLENFIWNNTSTPPSLSNISRKNVEYILTFAKQTVEKRFKGRLAEGNDAPLLNTGNPIRVLHFPPFTVSFNIPDGIYKKGKKKRVVLLDDVIVENGSNKNDFRLEFESKWTQETLDEEIKKGTIFLVKSEDFAIRYLRKDKEQEWITPDKYIDTIFLEKKAGVGTNEDAKRELKDLNINFPSYPKPTSLIHYLVRTNTEHRDIILDFFAGSGTTAHAVMKLNKEDGGKRKFILVEMADYFDTIIIPRIKKVAYSFNWKDGKPQDKDGIGVFFKYQYLEQYEDTLDNIELKEDQRAQELFKEEYLIKYFLDFETKDSPYLLNIEELKNPFAYKLKVNLSEVGEPQEVIVDIPETFNYLLGIKLKKIKKRKREGKDYLFILGEKENKNYTIVWREYEDNWSDEEFKKDKEFIIQEIKNWDPNIVYINGQSVLTTKIGDLNVEIRYIEPDFRKLMNNM
jgi:adenine-specific DNA-methyltransferase